MYQDRIQDGDQLTLNQRFSEEQDNLPQRSAHQDPENDPDVAGSAQVPAYVPRPDQGHQTQDSHRQFTRHR